ncbi:MAG: protein kinase [Nannocystaceae bacterium]
MIDAADDATLAGTSTRPGGVPAGDHGVESIGRGAAVGRYLVLSRVGAGAMGVVLAAYDPELDRKVALKILKPGGTDLRRARERLQREAQALAKLDHPNVVAVYDVGVHAEQLFVAMEFVAGQTLGQWTKSAPELCPSSSRRNDAADPRAVRVRPWQEVLEVFVQAGRGLAAAHEAGLVHRDFKPENVMLSEGGRVRVMDFGVARVGNAKAQAETDPDAPVDFLTQPGALMGTPAYMSPEQFGFGPIDARSDQFGFCVALHEALYGARPFPGQTVGELVHALHEGVVRGPPRSARVPSWVRAVVLRGLATNPDDRFASMQALLDALADDPAVRLRRWGLGLGLGLVLAASAWGVVALSGKLAQRDATIDEQQSKLEVNKAELADRLAAQKRLSGIQRGLRAKALAGTDSEAEALLLGVQAVGSFAGAWDQAPPEAVEGLEHVLAHDPTIITATHVLDGHEGDVAFTTFSPDGATVATSALDGEVRLWDAARGHLRATLRDGGDQFVSLAFSPEGTRLAGVGMKGRGVLWDVASGEPMAVLEGSVARLDAVEFSPDGRWLATAGRERHVRVWDARTGACRLTLEADDEGTVSALAFTPDGARLVTAGADGTARVWDSTTGEPLAVLEGHEQSILVLAISPDGTRVATGGRDRRARIWSLETAELVATLEPHDARVSGLVYSPDGTRLTTGSWDSTARIHDGHTGQTLATLDGGHAHGIAAIAYAPDGGRLVTSSFDGSVTMWDAHRGTLRARLRGHRADVWSAAFAPDGHRLATASSDGSARLWDVDDDGIRVLDRPEAPIHDFAYSPDFTRLVTMDTRGRVRLWDTERREPLRSLGETTDGRTLMAYYPERGEVARATHRGLQIWDTHTGAERSMTPPPGAGAPTLLRYSPRGTLLLVSWGPRVWVHDAQTLERISILDVELSRHRSIDLAPDDTRVAISHDSAVVQLWDPRTGGLVGELEQPGDSVISVRYSPDGSRLLIVSEDAGLRAWDPRGLVPLLSYPESRGARTIVFMAGGAEVAAVIPIRGDARVWDTKTGTIQLRIPADPIEPRTRGIEFSADGRRLATVGGGLLRTFDRESGAQLAHIDQRQPTTTKLALWPDSTRVTSITREGTIEVNDVDTGKSSGRERIGIEREDGSIVWPIPLPELTQLGCARLRVFDSTRAQAREICGAALDD